ncbi:MAG: cytochrome P450 [Carbonactinosporaceae bacterium]
MVAHTAPGPRGLEALRVVSALSRRPLAAMSALMRGYGDAVQVPLAPRRAFYLLSHPEHAEHVLVAQQGNYGKAFTYRPLRAMLGTGLLTSDGERWQAHRRLIQPLFAQRHVVSFAPDMVAATRRTLDRWDTLPEGAHIDVSAQISGLTLDVVGRALFGTDLRAEATRMAGALAVLQRAAVAAAFHPLTMASPRLIKPVLAAHRGYPASMRTLESTVGGIIDRRRAASRVDGTAPRDLLDLLLQGGEGGAGLSDQEIRDEVATFVLAGHETTANALIWTLVLLSAFPAARARLEDEVDAVPSPSSVSSSPSPTLEGTGATADDTDALPWTRAVISEAMRLYPPAWTIEREALGDDEVGGIRLPAGSTVAVPPYLIHRNPAVWPNPEGFDPGRFLGQPPDGRHRYAFLPFGGGRRGCVGASFALLEGTLVLAMLARRYRLDLLPGRRPVPEPNITLRPHGRLTMSLHRRA